MFEVTIAEVPDGWNLVFDGKVLDTFSEATDAYENVCTAAEAFMQLHQWPTMAIVVVWSTSTPDGALLVDALRQIYCGAPGGEQEQN